MKEKKESSLSPALGRVCLVEILHGRGGWKGESRGSIAGDRQTDGQILETV